MSEINGSPGTAAMLCILSRLQEELRESRMLLKHTVTLTAEISNEGFAINRLQRLVGHLVATL